MSWYLRYGDKYLGCIGLFNELALVEKDKAIAWDFSRAGENSYYMGCAGSNRFVKKFKDILAASGNSEHRAAFTLSSSTGFNAGSKLKLAINDDQVQFIKNRFGLGKTASEFILAVASGPAMEKIPARTEIELSDGNGEAEEPYDDEFNDGEIGEFHEEFGQDITSPPLHSCPRIPTLVPGSKAALASPEDELLESSITRSDADATPTAGTPLPPGAGASLMATRNFLEKQVVNLQRSMAILLEENAQCELLAKKCEQLDSSIERLSAMASHKESYKKHLLELEAELSGDFLSMFNQESIVAQRLRRILAQCQSHKAHMDCQLLNMEQEYENLLQEISQLSEEKDKYITKLQESRAIKDTLLTWHKENINTAQGVNCYRSVAAILDDVRQQLEQCDDIIAKAIESNDAHSSPTITGFN